MTTTDLKSKNLFGYVALRSLSSSSCLYISRECASDRLVVLKYFSRARQSLFEKEAKTLAKLAGFAGSPTLYFAIETGETEEDAFCLGMEYIAGKSLLELVQEKRADTAWNKIALSLNSLLHDLHERHDLTHGDLSPKNILIRTENQQAVLVDWEFAEIISGQSLSSYENYRGTEGFSPLDTQNSLVQKDQQALAACLRFAGMVPLQSQTTPVLPTKNLLKKWFPRKS